MYLWCATNQCQTLAPHSSIFRVAISAVDIRAPGTVNEPSLNPSAANFIQVDCTRASTKISTTKGYCICNVMHDKWRMQLDSTCNFYLIITHCIPQLNLFPCSILTHNPATNGHAYCRATVLLYVIAFQLILTRSHSQMLLMCTNACMSLVVQIFALTEDSLGTRLSKSPHSVVSVLIIMLSLYI